jgi:hypothetical protein
LLALKKKQINLYITFLLKNCKIQIIIKKKAYIYIFKSNMLLLPTTKKNTSIELSKNDLNIVYKTLILDAYLNQFKRVNEV